MTTHKPPKASSYLEEKQYKHINAGYFRTGLIQEATLEETLYSTTSCLQCIDNIHHMAVLTLLTFIATVTVVNKKIHLLWQHLISEEERSTEEKKVYENIV